MAMKERCTVEQKVRDANPITKFTRGETRMHRKERREGDVEVLSGSLHWVWDQMFHLSSNPKNSSYIQTRKKERKERDKEAKAASCFLLGCNCCCLHTHKARVSLLSLPLSLLSISVSAGCHSWVVWRSFC